jgi:DNA-binding NarL/FixJ family response regulator
LPPNTGTESALASDEPKKISIILADDHPLMRKALRDLLEQEPDLQVLGEAGNGVEAIDLTERFSPDVVIMDIAMPVMNGVEATERIKAFSPRTSVLILTVHTDIETIFSILQAGASGYLVKSVFGPEVIRTVRTLMDGDMVLAPGVSEAVVKYALRNVEEPVKPTKAAPRDRLSPKAREILVLAGKGMSNKEIATRLGVSEATVKGYLMEVFQLLDVRSRTEAVFVSLKTGLLALDDLL